MHGVFAYSNYKVNRKNNYISHILFNGLKRLQSVVMMPLEFPSMFFLRFLAIQTLTAFHQCSTLLLIILLYFSAWERLNLNIYSNQYYIKYNVFYIHSNTHQLPILSICQFNFTLFFKTIPFFFSYQNIWVTNGWTILSTNWAKFNYSYLKNCS